MSGNRRTTNGVHEMLNQFLDAYVEMWKRSLDFTGLTSRRKFWQAALINYLLLVVGNFFYFNLPGPLAALGVLYVLAGTISGWALGTRRVRDVRGSGWWILVGFIPLAGLVLIYWWALASKEKSDS